MAFFCSALVFFRGVGNTGSVMMGWACVKDMSGSPARALGKGVRGGITRLCGAGRGKQGREGGGGGEGNCTRQAG